MQFTPELKPLFKEIKHYPVLSQEEQNKLIEKAQAGDTQARDKIILSNMRLVIHTYKKYSSLANASMSNEDLIQEGIFGLLKTIEKFDTSKGYHFSTYATWWIMQSITRSSANSGRTIRLPVHIIERYQKIRKAKNELSQSLDRDPTPQEVSKQSGLPLDIVKATMASTKSPISLDAPVDENNNDNNSNRASSLEDMTADTPAYGETSAEKLTNNGDLHDQLTKVMHTIPENERDIVLAHFHLGRYADKNVAELADIFNISKARVNQIRMKAIRKLRSKDDLESLKDFL